MGRRGVQLVQNDFHLPSPHVEEGGGVGTLLCQPAGGRHLQDGAEFLNKKKALSYCTSLCFIKLTMFNETVKGVYMNECVTNKDNYRYIAVTFASRLIIVYVQCTVHHLHDCGLWQQFFFLL